MHLCRDLLAVSAAPGSAAPAPANAFEGQAQVTSFDGGTVWTRGSAALDGEVRLFALSRGLRDHDFRPLDPADLATRLLSGDGLDGVASPFAAAVLTGGEFVAASDPVGLRHLYAVQGDGWAAISTSALELARLAAAPLDRVALATYAATGFHIGQATPFEGVRKLPGNVRSRLVKGVLDTSRYGPDPLAGKAQGEPITAMVEFLRGSVERCLDRHPETVFELSGGLDSRMLFAAVPPARRADLRTLTLSSPGGADGAIAGAIAARYGTRHQVVDLTGLAALTPEAAHQIVMGAARRHDTAGNPVALGVLDWVEAQVEPGVRVTGQAGEMCRGSFHMGQRQHDRSDTALVDRLARLWFLTNEAVTPTALAPEFAARTQAEGLAAIRAAFAGYHTDWLTAIDEFFLRERIHRWVGINFSGACLDRTIAGIYLDPRFLAISMSVPPTVRSGSAYAARVIERLDPDLARVRMATGVRPTDLPRRYMPSAFAEFSIPMSIRRGGDKLVRLVRRQAHTAAGTPALADLVVRHWRTHPESVEPALRSGILREDWLAGLLAGNHGADAATVGFVANLAVAVSAR